MDTSIPQPAPGVDEAEYHVSRNFAYFIRIARNISRLNRAYGRIKRNRDWGLDDTITELNPSFHAWMTDLPADMAINYPPDGSPPWLASPYLGNIHSYYYLSIIMLHRPQLQLLDPTSVDGQWKHHMMICYSSAKLLCRLEEAILQGFGLTGLRCMQRGVNFTIYAILTCIVLHLVRCQVPNPRPVTTRKILTGKLSQVALTSPDPDLHSDAREYFTRHMRVLERCVRAWPMAEMQMQIDAMREAFSADTRKPFVLKASFPYGSPQAATRPSPLGPNARFLPVAQGRVDATVSQSSHASYATHPISPPISTGPVDGKTDPSPSPQSLAMMAAGQASQTSAMPGTLALPDGPTWNPSRIFE